MYIVYFNFNKKQEKTKMIRTLFSGYPLRRVLSCQRVRGEVKMNEKYDKEKMGEFINKKNILKETP